MKKAILMSLICGIIFACVALGIKYIAQKFSNENIENINTNISNNNEESNGIFFNTKDNTQVIATKSNSTLRIINYYDEDMFKGKNTILFVWASWCPHCRQEMNALNEILKTYKDDADLNIVFIAHEYKDNNLVSLLELLENGTVDFDTEILIDFGRVIRKEIDPEEGYVPRTYFLDKNCNVLEEVEHEITFEETQTLINKYYKAGKLNSPAF